MFNLYEVLPAGDRPIWRVAVWLMAMPVFGFLGYVGGFVWAGVIQAGGAEEIGRAHV